MLKPMLIGGAAAALLAMPLSPSAAAHGLDSPPPGKIVIDLVNVNGSGCPAGTAAVAVSPDNTAFTVTYSDYMAQVGVGARPTDFRKNCQLGLDVHVPQGFTYAVAEADYRGYGHLENGASGLERANYYFQGMQQTSYIEHPFSGPMDDDWQTTDTTDVASLVYAPCGEERNFNINTELRVNAGTSDPNTTSFLSMDSTDGSITTVYHFAWKQCPSR
ncbi:DUF4360 domain-containing protein [Streptomyces silvisoli]|uniref:DUF4360 domain-containing protein n=1 Tax=Streptomyces silvisoli TaxID=3034235 RepID=A0ABT5ZIU3_9ACTN|nr:DUF4360 domain-containing protein [Streptomyces silvisoli]MDF3289616.1 DUF4360 domain-containing protein [Streptomyces silvisoli]